MDISSISGISTSLYDTITSSVSATDSDDSFSSVLSSIMSAVSETNDLQNEAEEAEIQFALGETSNTHDLLVATTKAEVALQYTVAVRDKLVDGYKELMQMSI
jgi:flagellar hook-basal body complex protein FliE